MQVISRVALLKGRGETNLVGKSLKEENLKGIVEQFRFIPLFSSVLETIICIYMNIGF